MSGEGTQPPDWAPNHPISLPLAATGASSFPSRHMGRAMMHTGCTVDANHGG